ncbi:transmembrane protein, putative [Medicago truncatula]|uniref:Transmembrane protein, putative n=1 Tax=Medicago truncatula TaxID=3880 RepID=G7I3D1_MEDTR|nr:transmembrane protein, putative [Medicago truncatula]
MGLGTGPGNTHKIKWIWARVRVLYCPEVWALKYPQDIGKGAKVVAHEGTGTDSINDNGLGVVNVADWRHEYSLELNIVILVIFVGIGTLSFYAINMDVVSLLTDSSFSFLVNLNLYYIDILYRFE